MTIRLHVETDFAGDPDDASALAMLLGCGDADVVGVTRALDEGGRLHRPMNSRGIALPMV